MKSAQLRSWPGLILLLATAQALPAATPVIGSQLFQETNARIENLFQYRNAPPKAPALLDNPFRLNEPVPVITSTKPPADAVDSGNETGPHETADESLLRQAYANLHFGGLLQVGDRQMVVINKATYREGGLLAVRVQGNSIYLRIVALTKDSITLGLNEARLTLHF